MTANQTSGKLTLTINGSGFSELEGFYCEIDRVMIRDIDWKTGHNPDAFNDILRGGFGVFEYEEPIKLIWKDSLQTKEVLGSSLYQIIINLILEHKHIELELI